MDAEAYRKLQPQYTELLSQAVDYSINNLNILKTYRAAQDEALGRENRDEQVEYINGLKKGNKINKSYQLMRALTGNGPIAAYNDDDMPNINRPKFYGGSINKQVDKETADKVCKSYELMRVLMGAR
jgi:hypothetical protein